MTYKIIIDGATSQAITDKATAYANYRAVCRDYDNKPKKSSLCMMIASSVLKLRT